MTAQRQDEAEDRFLRSVIIKWLCRETRLKMKPPSTAGPPS